MPKKQPELTPEEKLQQENNFLKLKLMAENDAKFFEGGEKELDPKLENEWLNYISNYEKIHKDAKIVTLYEFIGKPHFTPANQLKIDDISEALESLLKIMADKDVSLSCICEYDDLVIYRFITEELFLYEMEDVRMPGMTTNFIYEEFHPNHEYDLRETTSDFLQALIHRKWNEHDDMTLNQEITLSSGKKIKRQEFREYIELFQDTWRRTELVKEDITEVWFDLNREQAWVELLLSYKTISNGNLTSKFSGRAVVHFAMENGYWGITKVDIPGFYSEV